MQPTQPEEPDRSNQVPKTPDEPKETPGDAEKVKAESNTKQEQDIHRLLWERTRRSRAIEMFLVQGILWLNLFNFDRGTFTGLRTIIPVAISTAIFTYLIISMTRIGSMFDLIAMIFFAFSSVLATFSTLYWNYGTTSNFSEKLTRLDAVYFAAGILSTAGTGDISAVSQAARGLQLLQMILDIGFIVFAVALAVAEISLRMRQKRR